MSTLADSRLMFNRKKVGIFLLDHAIEFILIALVLALALSVTGFWTWANWMNIFRANSLKGVIAFGMTMAIIAGLIDLSIGSTVALSGVIVARACRDLSAGGMDLTLACIIGISIAILLAVGVGWLHAFFSHNAGMPPFIVTLVSLNALYGLAGIVSGGFTPSVVNNVAFALGHILIASLIHIPAALTISRVMIPETGRQTAGMMAPAQSASGCR